MKILDQTRLFFQEAPLLKVVIPLLAGIFFQLHFAFTNCLYPLAALTFVAIIYFLFQQAALRNIFKFYWFNGFLIQTLIFCVGIFITQANDVTQQKKYYSHFVQNSFVAKIKLLENPVAKASSYKALAEVQQMDKQTTFGKTVVYFEKKSFNPNLKYGDELWIKNNFVEIKNSGNPACYDYKFYCLTQGISHQIFLKEKDFQKTGNSSNPFWKTLYSVRDSVLTAIEKNTATQKEIGVAQALLIGYRDNLDKDLQQIYSDTGIVHILAISGMHLGMIFWLLNKILFFLDKKRKTKIIKSVVVLTIIWLFTLLTGSSGSIVRAAVMFSFLQLTQILKHKVSVYNSLAASAFILLIIDPYIAVDVGFQLSYIAVIGIITLQKFISNWYHPTSWLGKKIWNDLFAVSIAAQIAAFPICIFYFHQFPIYFLLANLIAIPISTAALFGEIGVVLFSFLNWNFLAKLFGMLTCWLIMLMNKGIEWVDDLPMSVLNGLRLNIFQTTLIYLLIAFFIVWLLNKKVNYLKLSLATLLIFLCWKAIDDEETFRRKKIAVYAIPHGSAVDLINGKNCIAFADSMVTVNHITQNFHLKPARILFDTKVQERNFLKNETINFSGKKIFYWCQPMNNNDTIASPDILIIAHNAIKNVKEISEYFNPKLIVFDSSNSFYKIKKWEKEADELNIKIWNTATKGALVADL